MRPLIPMEKVDLLEIMVRISKNHYDFKRPVFQLLLLHRKPSQNLAFLRNTILWLAILWVGDESKPSSSSCQGWLSELGACLPPGV